MHAREHPWNIRRVTHRHLHDQANLIDLHALTQSWLTEGDGLANPFDQERTLEDDTWPEDVLGRLAAHVQELQQKTLKDRLSQSVRLSERSYIAGQESASKRWMQSDPQQGSIAPGDKRALIFALYHSPLAYPHGPRAFLIRRALITEVTLELLQCPHHASGMAKDVQDELCKQQFHWLRGYFNFLNPALSPAISRPRGRCLVSW